jgi:LuxR family transcriptional regulator, maltose regulon positive regulatory protein
LQARPLMREIDGLLRRRPSMGTLVGEAAALHDQLEKSALLLSRVVGTDRRRAALAAVAGHPHVLATHMPAREIAAEMFLSAHTIRTQMKSIYRRLGVDSRIQAVTRARELGLVED